MSYEYLFDTPSKASWQRISTRRRAGILVPLFSVYSQDSVGIGDFDDLKKIIDWAFLTGNSIVQLLPMNEVGSVFCPYDSVSSFALEPLYLSFNGISRSLTKTLAKKIQDLARQFPAGKPHVDYNLKAKKLALLWEIFEHDKGIDTADFNNFMEKQAGWLSAFACFKVLKFYQQGKAWYEWEPKYRDHEEGVLEGFCREHEKEILFQIWLQWHAYRQLKSAKDYASSKGVLLKGDLPILVSRDSADVWANPEYFKLEFAAGAPPDMYCAKGQRWGMPTYNWEAIAQDGYEYLHQKLQYAENFYDILRVDHVVGLFRIWSISYLEPAENHGLNGFFDPRDEAKWEEHGKRLLSEMLSSSEMLLCAEDLGVIPRSCTDTLRFLGIPGNDVQRWVKDWNVRHDFLSPNEYRELSVSMLSTHDTTSWAAWWENEAGTVDEVLFIRKCYERMINYHAIKHFLFDPHRSRHGRLRWLESVDSVEKLLRILGKHHDEARDFVDMYQNTYREKENLWRLFGLAGAMRERCDKEIASSALQACLNSRAIFSIQLITDWLYLAEVFSADNYAFRINTPGVVSEKNWSLVMPIAIEDLLKHPLNEKISGMVSEAGR